MSEPEVLVEIEGGVATLTLARPAQLNAMTETMVAGIVAGVGRAVARAPARSSCAPRAWLLCGSRQSPGRSGRGGRGRSALQTFNPMVRAVADLDIPTVAAVQGACRHGAGPRARLRSRARR